MILDLEIKWVCLIMLGDIVILLWVKWIYLVIVEQFVKFNLLVMVYGVENYFKVIEIWVVMFLLKVIDNFY